MDIEVEVNGEIGWACHGCHAVLMAPEALCDVCDRCIECCKCSDPEKEAAMAFMQRVVERGVFYEVETSFGTFIVPEDVCGPKPTKEELAIYQPEMMGSKNLESWEVRRVKGWYGRLSAPGYLDCTDWEGSKTKAGLIEQLEIYE